MMIGFLGYVARMGDGKMASTFYSGYPKEKDTSET
jgi:hypothetical protein